MKLHEIVLNQTLSSAIEKVVAIVEFCNEKIVSETSIQTAIDLARSLVVSGSTVETVVAITSLKYINSIAAKKRVTPISAFYDIVATAA